MENKTGLSSVCTLEAIVHIPIKRLYMCWFNFHYVFSTYKMTESLQEPLNMPMSYELHLYHVLRLKGFLIDFYCMAKSCSEFFYISYIAIYRRSIKVTYVWNSMKVMKWWENLFFHCLSLILLRIVWINPLSSSDSSFTIKPTAVFAQTSATVVLSSTSGLSSC